MRVYLLYESPGFISLCHRMSKPFVSQPCFPFQVWPDLKPRLYRSAWRAFASIHRFMPFSTSPTETLFACPTSPLWNLLFFTVESTLSSPCSRSDPLLTRQGAALAHLDSLPPYDLNRFPFGKSGSGVLGNCSLCGTEATLAPFRQVQFIQVFPLKPAPFCTLFGGLVSTNKSATSFALCPRLRLSFYLKLSGRNCLLFLLVLSSYNEFPDIYFSR